MIHEVTWSTVTCPKCKADPGEPCHMSRHLLPHEARMKEAATVFRILNAEAISNLAKESPSP